MDNNQKIKTNLRKFFLEKRNKITKNYALLVSNKISNYAKEIINLYKPKIISGFFPYRGEINTIPLLKNFLSFGCSACLPVTPQDNSSLEFKQWTPDVKMTIGRFGIQEPNKECKNIIPDLLLVPLLAYDGYGNRLGYGGGFYDRTIKKLTTENKNTISIGVAFKNQKCNKIPIDLYDMPLNSILNEDGISKFIK